MLTARLSIIFFLISSGIAFGYLPPSFFLAKKITDGRDSAESILAQVAVYRAAPNHKEADELLWQQYILLPNTNASLAAQPWPGLSILIESNSDRLSAALKRFGLPVASEESLARFKSDQLRSMKETPRPFYHMDPNMSLRKEGKQLAWVLSSQNNQQSFWIEKSSFYPLFLRGICPKSVDEISWAKNDEAPCELSFESISGLKGFSGKRTAAILKRNSQPLIKFVVKKIFYNPAQQLVKDSLEKNAQTTTSIDQDLLPLIHDFLN